ncbi:hypothetical protein PIB30_093884, partial [Stylosanthes scabra]|nr:hypothetical protein [Stylosanthes scabra]
PKEKKTWGKTNCKKLHNSEFKDRQEVEFYQGQPIGPTRKVVSDLRNFVGTVDRNPTFVTLLYTSWHGVSDKSKEDMWEYINEKFILPIESKQWVMQALCRAWKKYKGQIKLLHFTKYKTKKQMIWNRPLHIPEVQFRKLIRYWRLPEIKHDSKENNEEPSRAEIFTVTRSSKKGKEIDPKSQSTIDELKSRTEAGENHEDAFVQVLGKDQPGRLHCYGASITKSSLKKHEEIRQVKVECKDMVSSLQQQIEGVCGLLTMMMQQINPGMSEKDIAALIQAARNTPSDPSDASSSRPRVNTPRSSESTHFPPNGDSNRHGGIYHPSKSVPIALKAWPFAIGTLLTPFGYALKA